MDARELLGKALEIIERDGWHQGQYFDDREAEDAYYENRISYGELKQLMEELARTAPVCSLGALARAQTGKASLRLRGDLVDAKKLLKEQIPERWANIAAWNDDKNTTLEDVKLAFKKAIEDAA